MRGSIEQTPNAQFFHFASKSELCVQSCMNVTMLIHR